MCEWRPYTTRTPLTSRYFGPNTCESCKEIAMYVSKQDFATQDFQQLCFFFVFSRKYNLAICGPYLTPCGLSIAPYDAQAKDVSNGIISRWATREPDPKIHDLLDVDIFKLSVFQKVNLEKPCLHPTKMVGGVWAQWA